MAEPLSWSYRLRYAAVKLRCTWDYLWSSSAKGQGVALHCMFRNEAPFLAEWLAYHFLIGVEHVYLTNDQSNDHFASVVQPYLDRGLVSLEEAREDLDFYAREEWHKNHILAKARGKYRWLAFIDADEFIYCQGGNLNTGLQPYTAFAGIVLNWFMYGTSGKEDLAGDELLVEHCLRRFPDQYHEHRAVKSIVQPGKGLRFFNRNPHYPAYSPLARLRQVDGRRFRPAQRRILREPLSINHYWYRSEKYYREVKRPRRRVFEGKPRAAHIESWHREQANALRDDRLKAYADRIREFNLGLKN